MKPSMLQVIRYSKAWYKYQVYAPRHEGADDLGYVHFESKKEMNKFMKGNK